MISQITGRRKQEWGRILRRATVKAAGFVERVVVTEKGWVISLGSTRAKLYMSLTEKDLPVSFCTRPSYQIVYLNTEPLFLLQNNIKVSLEVAWMTKERKWFLLLFHFKAETLKNLWNPMHLHSYFLLNTYFAYRIQCTLFYIYIYFYHYFSD